MEEEELVQVTVRIPRSLWRRAKVRAAEEERDLRDLVMEGLERCLAPRRIRVIIEVSSIEARRLGEIARRKVGRYTAVRHQPHFSGGEVHGHSALPGGSELSWTITGQRLHTNKFPADHKIPKDAKAAVAQVLGVDVSLLEAVQSDQTGEDDFIIAPKGRHRKELVEEFVNTLLGEESDPLLTKGGRRAR
jgi:hypothetical protein